MTEFVPGDMVRIVRKTEDFNPGWDNDWVVEMEEMIDDGAVYKVRYVEKKGIALERIMWRFDPASLEKVQ